MLQNGQVKDSELKIILKKEYQFGEKDRIELMSLMHQNGFI